MIKTISNQLEAVLNPVRNELRLAQQQAIERIQKVILNAEKEVAQESRFLTTQQRIELSMTELEKAEEHLLSALGSMVKALRLIAPESNLFTNFSPLKDIKGTVINKVNREPVQLKLGFFGKRSQ